MFIMCLMQPLPVWNVEHIHFIEDKIRKFLCLTDGTTVTVLQNVPHVSQGQGPDGIDHIGMATNKFPGEWHTKSITGRPEAEMPVLSVYVNDIKTVKYNIKTVSEFC